MEAVAHQCSHLSPCRHVKGTTHRSIKTFPPSTFLPPSRHIETITLRITHRSMKTLAAVDGKNGDSAPPPAGHDEGQLPLGSFVEHLNYMEEEDPKLPSMSLSDVLNSTPPNCAECNYSYHLYNIEKIRRRGRKFETEMFRSQYTYGNVKEGCNNSKEQKTCIWPGDTLSWQDESSGIMWVGVYGRDSICVVTRNEDPDETRLRGMLKQYRKDSVLFRLMKSSIVEIEDLASQSSKICERFHTRIKKPFGVVSVIPDAYKSHKGSGHEASSVEYGETKAIEFLQEKVKNRRLFTVTGTIQTAIAAFEQLLQKKFKADEIKVSVVDPFYFNSGNDGIDTTVQSLTIRQINEHLAVINKPGSKDSWTLWEQYYASASSVSSRL